MRQVGWVVLCAVVLSLALAGTGRANVTVLGVTVDRGRDVDVWGHASYHQTVLVRVQMSSSLDNLDCILIGDTADNWCNVYCPMWDSDEAAAAAGQATFVSGNESSQIGTFGLRETHLARAPLAGAYQIHIEADGGDSVLDVNTPAAAAVPITGPSLQQPEADAVIDSTAPTFQWTNWTGTQNWLQLREEGNDTSSGGTADDLAQLWWANTGTRTSAVFNFDGSASRSALLPGRSYLWQLGSAHTDHQGGTPAMTMTTTQTAYRRFSVYTDWSAMPALPGEIAFGSILWGDGSSFSDAIRSYSQNLRTQQWLAPDSSYDPVWSQDGSTLVFMRNGLGLWREEAQSHSPVHLPLAALGDPSLSPDGQRVAYTGYDIEAGAYQIRSARLDGTDDRVVVQAEGYDIIRRPAWSPSGTWIAYTKRPADAVTCSLWLVHPDGSDGHAAAATGVVGYDGYVPHWVDEPSWSPDEGKLAVAFNALSADGRYEISGVGVLPGGGGLIKPLFLAPADVVCCAAPSMPTWSPSGTAVLFVSGHHLTPDPEWIYEKFEPGVELWMVDADGRGPLTRLTDNASYDAKASWWAPLAFPDVTRGTWAFNAINTCAEAQIVKGYADGYRPGEAVKRDQMAVYIARALCGGDSLVPAGPPTPSFGDVPADYWAYKYIEYCKGQNVVQGYADGYRPDVEVKRDQMAVFIGRAVSPYAERPDLPGYTPPTTPSFPDVPIGYWAFKHIEFCHADGVVNGYGDGYRPDVIVLRDQMAVFVARAFELPM